MSNINTFAIINGVNAIVALLVLFTLSLRRSRRPIHLAYGAWNFFLFMWSFSYCIWGLERDRDKALFWLHLTVLAICFLHSTFYHSCIILAGSFERRKADMIGSYVSSVALGIMCVNSAFFDLGNVRPLNDFPHWPKGSAYLFVLIAIETYYVCKGLIILLAASAKGPLSERIKQRSYAGASSIAWLFGWTNWFGFYDWPPMLPYANLGVSVYILATAYLIIRHDLLSLNVALQRTVMFAILTLCISTAFSLSVVLSERIFREYFRYGSLVGTLFASMIIALLITPLKELLSNKLSVLIYGKNIEGLSVENTLLMTQVQQTAQMRSVATLAAGMAHEIKNPLTAIKTFTEHLPSKAADPAFLEKFRAVVGQEVDKIDSIVRQVLEFSRPQANITDSVSIQEILESTLDLLNAQMTRNKVIVEQNLPVTLPLIRGDRKLLQQALLNILINSIEAMPSGGRLRVEAGATGGRMQINITDTGYGITSSALPRIFDPFYSGKESGTGLGLSIVKSILDQHNGKITVRSVVGQGTEFMITLPV